MRSQIYWCSKIGVFALALLQLVTANAQPLFTEVSEPATAPAAQKAAGPGRS